ncbi:MAG: hypothetical protein EPO28_13135 [Saprospiraceae bacterium]|nr:MAG: hypothetical protein EPO28_13135 [Saprospiraceae bacterium]
MKKLPIGIQTLSHIIDGGYVYVDKTEIAHRLITSGKYYFLSRPRRFGKSLFLDTLKEIFEGNKALFKGLYVEDQWDFEDKYPVLRISFGAGVNKNTEELDRSLRWLLKGAEEYQDIQCTSGSNPKECFQEIIKKTSEKYGKNVVILIDEYDKPILDNITDKDTARAIRDVMKDFYSVIKDNDQYVEFVFITGVSKFSKLNLFSGLNNLNDITLDGKYGNICGYTHQDLTRVFGGMLDGVDMDKVKEWYNGYNYFGEKVYNPFDILLFIDKGFEFRNYWWGTGNPSFLIDLIRSKNYSIPDVENYEATDAILDSFDVDSIELEPLLWQTGYLTIKEKYTHANRIRYRLEIPNLEIQHSLNDFFIDVLTTQKQEKSRYQGQLYEQLKAGNAEALKTTLVSLFAGIPYQNFTNNKIAGYEGYYASVIYAYLASLGFETIPDDTTQHGSVDMTLKLDDKAYIFEFKAVEKPTGNALRQIRERQYHLKYQSNKDCYLIGIEFGKQERNIVHYEWELLPRLAH